MSKIRGNYYYNACYTDLTLEIYELCPYICRKKLIIFPRMALTIK